MTGERVAALFAAALELPEAERDTFLRSSGEESQEVRDEVARLISAYVQAGDFLEPPLDPERALALLNNEKASEEAQRGRMTLLGTTIGKIRIVDVLGEGGMGEVYVGFDEKLKRRVAIKSIRFEHAMDAEMKARFLQEARILSQLRHPNICQIHDFIEGEDNDLLVLELIEGKNLKQALRDGLDRPTKMKIAEQIAAVLTAAHAEGVVHRDLKPANVMLADDDEVKVLDFGLARTVDVEGDTMVLSHEDGDSHSPSPSSLLTLGSLHLATKTGALMGTPQYMSPEQARQELVTPASDMYSFGLLLQELFTGEPPYKSDQRLAGLVQMMAAGKTVPVTGLDRDLTTLIQGLKSLLPAERPTAKEAVNRLRWIRDKPRRRLRRWVAAVVVLAFFLGGIRYTFDLGVERNRAIAAQLATERARLEAVQAGQEAEEVVHFLVELFEVTDPYGQSHGAEVRGETITARELLDRGADRLETELEDRPEVRAQLLDTIGVVYQSLALYDDSERLLDRALALRREVFGEDHLEVAETLVNLAVLYRRQGRYDDVEAPGRRALEIQETAAADPHDLIASLTILGLAYRDLGRYPESESLHERALEIGESALEPDDPALASSLDNLGLAYSIQSRYAEAEPLHERSLVIREETLGPDHPVLVGSLYPLARVYKNSGRDAEAEQLYRRALAIREQTLAPDHPDVAQSLTVLGLFFKERGRYRDAVPLLERALEINEEALGPHPYLALSYSVLALVYTELGRFDEAGRLHERALALREELLGPEHVKVAYSLNNLGWHYWGQGRYDKAETYYRRALYLFEKAFGSDHQDVANTLTNLGLVDWKQGQLSEAETSLHRSLVIREQIFGFEHPFVAETLWGLASVYRDQRRFAEAEPLYLRAIAIQERTLAPESNELRNTLSDYDELLRATGRDTEQ